MSDVQCPLPDIPHWLRKTLAGKLQAMNSGRLAIHNVTRTGPHGTAPHKPLMCYRH
jgi:hypothetical protein